MNCGTPNAPVALNSCNVCDILAKACAVLEEHNHRSDFVMAPCWLLRRCGWKLVDIESYRKRHADIQCGVDKDIVVLDLRIIQAIRRLEVAAEREGYYRDERLEKRMAHEDRKKAWDSITELLSVTEKVAP